MEDALGRGWLEHQLSSLVIPPPVSSPALQDGFSAHCSGAPGISGLAQLPQETDADLFWAIWWHW